MGLDVGILGSEELLDAVDCKVFNLVDYLTSAVIALAGITFGILVCETRAHGAHHFVADIVFRSNQLDTVFLATVFGCDEVENLIVGLHVCDD